MSRIGLVGPSYTSQSPIADAERTANLYVEAMESDGAKVAKALYSSPGTKHFATLPDRPVRAEYYHPASGRAFAVAGSSFCEILADGTFAVRGAVGNDGSPASIDGSNIQVMIAAGQRGYCFTLATNVFSAIDPAALVNPLIVQYVDGFFVALRANSNQFQYSNALDGLTWNGANVAAVSVFPDNIVTFLADHREVLLGGPKKSTVYYDSGNVFTFDVVPGGFVEQGAIAAFARNRLDNTFFWLGGSERGGPIAWKAQGYLPVRVSTHAVEYIWKGYSRVSDAVSYAFEMSGHTFWHIYFPSANGGRGASWRYDAATQQWHEVFFLQNGLEYAHRSQCHMFAFGKHLVGDWNSGNIYQMDDSFYDDDGNDIRRVRRTPTVANEGQRITGHYLQLDLEVGLGPEPPFTTDGLVAAANGSNWRGPLCMLRWSDDGTKTWSNEHWRDCGQAGEYRKRVFWRQLGQWFNRVFEWSATDPVPWRLVDAYLDASGYGRVPTQRLAEKLRQQA